MDSISIPKKDIDDISKKYEFKFESYIEKLLMDVKLGNILTNELDCRVRGGLCFLLLSKSRIVTRLSKDIDILVKTSEDETEENISNIMKKHGIICKRIPKSKHLPIKNFMKFEITYDSHYDDKILLLEIDYNVNITLPRDMNATKTDLFEYEFVNTSKLLTKGTLMIDKIIALSLPPIGTKREFNIIKHIHDVGTLLRQSSTDDLKESIEVLSKLMEYHINQHNRINEIGIEDVIKGIETSLQSKLDCRNNLKLEDKHQTSLGEFRGKYIAPKGYVRSMHLNNILLVWRYLLYLKESLIVNFDIQNQTNEMHNIIQRNQELLNETNKKKTKDNIHGENYKFLRNEEEYNKYLCSIIDSKTGWFAKF